MISLIFAFRHIHNMLIYESHVCLSIESHGFRLIPVMGIDLHTPAMLISE